MNTNDKLIDLTYLEQSFGSDLIPEMLNLYKEQVPEFTEDIQKSFEKSDWLALSKVAHKAKGSWVIVGTKKYADMFRNFQLICETFHFHKLNIITQDRDLNEDEQKVFDELKERRIDVDAELDVDTTKLLLEELDRFKNGEKLQIVPEYTETSLRILKDSLLEVDEILSEF
ncbi:MAG: hypothetical protein U9R19_09560 [Bacteroidota bacterium]|nr:hypothetical protein [Bacteroidota bacterium]